MGPKSAPSAPARRRRAEHERRVHARRRRVRGRSRCPAPSSDRACARRPGRGRGAHTAAAPAWPSWGPTGARRSRRRVFFVISVIFGPFCSFLLLRVGILVVLDDPIARANILAARAPPGPRAARPGRASAAAPTAPIGQATPVGRGRRFGANRAVFRGGREVYGPPVRWDRPGKGRGARVAPLSGAPAAPVRAITRAASTNPWRRLAKAAARSRSATASTRGAPVCRAWCAVGIAGARRFARLVHARGGRRGRA